MIENSGTITSVSLSRSTSCSDSNDDDEVSTVQEFEDYCDPQAIGLPGFDPSHLATTVVKMKNSTNVNIKPITKFVIHQHYQNTDQPRSAVTIPNIPTNGTPNKECGQDSEPHVTLNTSRQKFYHTITSNISWKIGLLLILTTALIIVVIIVCLALLNPKENDAYKQSTAILPYPAEGDNDLGNDIHIFQRDRWGGRPIRDGYQNRTLVHPINLVIISHTVSKIQYMTFEECAHYLQAIQSDHVSDHNYVDIKYNFVVGGDGNIYEALGWDIQNYLRNNSIQISFIGNYIYDFVKDRQRMAVQALLKRGVELGKLDKDYRLIAHNQVANTKSPGTNLLSEMKLWPHYYNGTFT